MHVWKYLRSYLTSDLAVVWKQTQKNGNITVRRKEDDEKRLVKKVNNGRHAKYDTADVG